jgi:hypothetical protein
MPKTIYKYELKGARRVTTLMHKNAIVLSANVQNDRIYIYAFIDVDANLVEHDFFVIGTGRNAYPICDKEFKFVGTVTVQDVLVFHVFDLGETVDNS